MSKQIMDENRMVDNFGYQNYEDVAMDSSEPNQDIPDPVVMESAGSNETDHVFNLDEQSRTFGDTSKTKGNQELHKVDDCTINYDEMAVTYDAYILSERLKHIAEACPSKKEEVYRFLLQKLMEKTRNIAACSAIHQKLVEINPDIPKLDPMWKERITNEVKACQFQLKNDHKEAVDSGSIILIRNNLLAQCDLAIETGDFVGANKLLALISSDYVTEEIHHLSVFIRIIRVAMYQECYDRLDAILQQLKRHMSVYDNNRGLTGDNKSRNCVSVALKKELEEYEMIKMLCSLYSGFHAFIKGHFTDAAMNFKNVNLDLVKPPYTFSPKDISRYAALSALACDINSVFNDDDSETEEIDREINLKNKHPIASNPAFRKLINRDDKIQHLFDSFYKNDFEQTFTLIEEMKNEFFLDKHISSQYNTILNEILKNSILRYMKPLSNGRIDVMAKKLHIDVSELINYVEDLVFAEKIECKMDMINMTFNCEAKSNRKEFFENLILSQQFLLAKSRISYIRGINLFGNVINGDHIKVDDLNLKDRKNQERKYGNEFHQFIGEQFRRKPISKHLKNKKKFLPHAADMDVEDRSM
uniref:PCI domain-containing protein n=1 Tax=Strongyloides stercoralis TaxID=6248 RepID=A0A0K0DUL0_STRER